MNNVSILEQEDLQSSEWGLAKRKPLETVGQRWISSGIGFE